MATECPLQDVAVLGAIKQGTPLFQLAYPFRGFLRMELRHAPVVQKFTAAHGVAKVRAPVVGRIHVGHCSSDATLCHHGVGFAEQRLAHNADSNALRKGLNCGAQARTTSADDEHIVFVDFVFRVHRSRMSFRRPAETMRT